MKTYVLTVSRYFPKTHKKSGKETWFIQQIQNALHNYKETVVTCYDQNYKETDIIITERKIHTIRQNVELWQKRISEIQKGNAILSIRYWSGTKQVEICQLNRFSGIGLEEVVIPCMNDIYSIKQLAMNDGLSLEDFEEWFKKYDFSKSLAIIHFTAFRYFSYNAR